ncbi:nucleic acid-binding protein [Trichodelitschia bisporula]|uniref:Nucleic acid-binding protein n=1 Tax=Trichodelitschia bisporula TaxID=703511 RepID=A0A6G1HLJ0_9PEZI|nr:nucleic acid-binding protein [Trichodelitschia bisporula]
MASSTPTWSPNALSLIAQINPAVDPSMDPAVLSSALYPIVKYTPDEAAEIERWASFAASDLTPEKLGELNTHLSSRTTVLGSKPSVADLALYAALQQLVPKWTPEERTGEHGYHHVVRYVDFVQNAPVSGLALGKRVAIDVDQVLVPVKPLDVKAEKERKKREKEAAEQKAKGASGEKGAPAKETAVPAAAGAPAPAEQPTPAHANKKEKKEKKEKAPKPPKAPAAPEKPPSPAAIDLRVGHILKAIQHPNADSLYVSTIAVGDAPGTENTAEYEGRVVRTVCSGLNGLVPLEAMQGRKIVAVCNLKPVTMRGVKSCAMVLAASPRVQEGGDAHAGPVELVAPPEGAEAGERVFFEGWEGQPEGVLNPKKKVWETFQPGFTTTDGLEVAFEAGAVPVCKEVCEKEGKKDVAVLRTKQGVCKVETLKGATVR